jgi:predicted permease
MDTLRRDLRGALISMRASRTFALTVLITLALGIGGATTVFSLGHAVLVRALPYPAANRLVRLWEEQPGGVSPAGNRWLSSHTYVAWRDRTRTLDALGGYSSTELTVSIGPEPERMPAARVSANVFAMLDVEPAQGRFFDESDALLRAEPVVVLSDELWRERYGSDPQVLGRVLLIDGRFHRIVAVAKPGFSFPATGVRVWVPYVLSEESGEHTNTRVFTALGRLKIGASPREAEVEGTTVARSVRRGPLTEFFFGKGGAVVVHARPLLEDMTQSVRPAMSVLALASGLVLLIACANVASLVLSRGIARQRELAVRVALGGTRLRLIRQLATEQLVLVVAGGGLGFLLAWWLIDLVPEFAPTGLPRLDEARLDISVVGYYLLTTSITALMSGVVPAWRVASVRYDAFRESDISVAAGFRGRRSWVRNALLSAEAAFATLLIVGATLLAHSFVRLMNRDSGYTAQGVLTAFVSLPRDTPAERSARFVDTVVSRLETLQGVVAAGAANMIPLMAATAVTEVALPDHVSRNKPSRGRALLYIVTPGYARALGMRVKLGRFFTESDTGQYRRPVVVNAEFVRQYVSVDPVVGLHLPKLLDGEDRIDTEIIGVSGNVLKAGNAEAPQPEIYVLHHTAERTIGGNVKLVLRADDDTAALVPAVRQIVREIEPFAVVDRVEPLAVTLSASMARPRFATGIVGGFAALALFLAAIGLYGVLSYAVSQRRREFGMRIALGASRAHVIGSVLREGLWLTTLGVATGLVLAASLAGVLRLHLFDVAPWDPVAFTVAPTLLFATAAVACAVPAIRAASTDPAATLRGD